MCHTTAAAKSCTTPTATTSTAAPEKEYAGKSNSKPFKTLASQQHTTLTKIIRLVLLKNTL
jgi:hypothetical protein